MQDVAFGLVVCWPQRSEGGCRFVSRTTRRRCYCGGGRAGTRRELPSATATAPSLGTLQIRRFFRPAEELPGFWRGRPGIVRREDCFYVGVQGQWTDKNEEILKWLLAETWEPNRLTWDSQLGGGVGRIIEVGPRLNFQTAWCSNAVSICRACGLAGVVRLERSRRYHLTLPEDAVDADYDSWIAVLASEVHDRMTEQVYSTPLQSFDSGLRPAPTISVDLLRRGRSALEDMNDILGLGLDERDVEYYLALFREDLKRNPTDVELFDLAQSNSEHSRHWFFKGKLVIDGEPVPEKHLFDIVRQPLLVNRNNSVVAFADNSSTIRGFGPLSALISADPRGCSSLQPADMDYDLLFTAETHNFPTGVAPFPGAETGVGGRLRDTAATGKGSLAIAGTAGYSVGHLHIPGYSLEWEDSSDFLYPDNLATPLSIIVQASNGASDYGNKFGEPLICGFTRSLGIREPWSGIRREYVKPIMFSGGFGMILHSHSDKCGPEIGDVVVKVGGPAYRIGLGGGAASSMVQGDNRSELDFNAVQRGDAEMEQKVYRVLRSCVELGNQNPIISLHDQGAGGNCNVIKELIYPCGATIDLRQILVGDESLSALEIWGAEYQEQFGLLLRQGSVPLFQSLCERENVEMTQVGVIDGSGRVVVWDSVQDMNVVDLELEKVLGDLPQKVYEDKRAGRPPKLTTEVSDSLVEALGRVLRLLSVGSKRFLTTKVDRSVTGLVARQQCVGPLYLPLADCAIVCLSHLERCGGATAIGERPSLSLLDPAAMARMSTGEMVLNLAAARVTKLQDIKCEGNWMWPAKLQHEAAAMYDAAVALRNLLIELGIAIDGGKDSVSMAARCPTPDDGVEVSRAPGTLVMSGYCTCPDVTVVQTPDLKSPGSSVVLHIDIARGKRRTGGSALDQVYGILNTECPDLDVANDLKTAFEFLQTLYDAGSVLSYHDVSEGGLITALLEMGFAGNCGLDININSSELGVSALSCLFAEELGFLIEVGMSQLASVEQACAKAKLDCRAVAITRTDSKVLVRDEQQLIMEHDIRALRDQWEETSFQLERLQANPICVESEQSGLFDRRGFRFLSTFQPRRTDEYIMNSHRKPRVAIIREEGSNGDREMAAAFHLAGFEPWDVCVRDIASGRVDLSLFRGAAFVGGFSFADVFDSAKGWSGGILYQEKTRIEMERFLSR